MLPPLPVLTPLLLIGGCAAGSSMTSLGRRPATPWALLVDGASGPRGAEEDRGVWGRPTASASPWAVPLRAQRGDLPNATQSRAEGSGRRRGARQGSLPRPDDRPGPSKLSHTLLFMFMLLTLFMLLMFMLLFVFMPLLPVFTLLMHMLFMLLLLLLLPL